LVSAIYRVTADWPSDERFGLISQTRRAAVSIPSNIAEGQGRLGKAELRHHLSIAHGSLCELETLLVVASDIGLLEGERQTTLLAQTNEVGRLLRGFIRSLEGKTPSSGELAPNSSTPRLLDSSTGH
jgi:four helix bundle protein